MKLLLLQDYLVGSRMRAAGAKIDTDRELGEMLVSSGLALEEGQVNKKKNVKLNK